MFTPFDHEDSTLDEEIARVYTHLSNFSAEDKEYSDAVNQLTKLYALKNQSAQLNLQAQTAAAAQQLSNDQNAWQEEQECRPFIERIDPSVVLTVAGNLVIALIVIKYEQKSVISTKALSFLKKF